MQAVFHGERNSARNGSGLTGVYQQQPSSPSNRHHSHSSNSQQQEVELDAARSVASIDSGYFGSHAGDSPTGSLCVDAPCGQNPVEVTEWMEIWDYQGGASFRAFVAEDAASGERSLLTFFGAGVVGRDLKKALVALIELTETPLGCSRLIVCIDRSIEDEELTGLTKGLQWAGFELETLDQWAEIRDVTSSKWIFMGMDV